MIILAAENLDLMPWLVCWLILPAAICLWRPSARHFRPSWDD